MADITISGLRKSYGGAEIVHGIDLAVRDGEFVVVLGPSGCGKSTLLRLIAGLIQPSSGAIYLDRGNMAEAEKLLRHAISLNQKHFNATYDLGRLLVKTNRHAEALPLLQRAAGVNPNSVEVHYQIFLALSRLKKKADAERELEIYKQLREKENVPKPER